MHPVELVIAASAESVLRACAGAGLVVRSEGTIATKPGSRHWHLAKRGASGTLELSEWQGRVWLKVARGRDGGWATALAHELETRFGS